MINGPVSEAARRCRVQGREKPLWACTWTGAYGAKVRPELGPWDGWEHTSRVGEKVAGSPCSDGQSLLLFKAQEETRQASWKQAVGPEESGQLGLPPCDLALRHGGF